MSNGSNEKVVEVVACQPMYTGYNTRGDKYTIFEVKAKNQQGQLIQHQLRSFEELPLGQKVEVTVVPFESEQHGRSYTLHPKKSTVARIPPEVKDLAEHVRRLTDSHTALVNRVNQQAELINQLMSDQVV